MQYLWEQERDVVAAAAAAAACGVDVAVGPKDAVASSERIAALRCNCSAPRALIHGLAAWSNRVSQYQIFQLFFVRYMISEEEHATPSTLSELFFFFLFKVLSSETKPRDHE
mmetsp:Transcript_4465/g.8841  ORF Transcript_4465/g.8841 Transcript_4465/m.8841 type:complete len:112 (-) Transcript_4465:412-747(-)